MELINLEKDCLLYIFGFYNQKNSEDEYNSCHMLFKMAMVSKEWSSLIYKFIPDIYKINDPMITECPILFKYYSKDILELNLIENYHIDDDLLSLCTNLTSLNLIDNELITDECLSKLTTLIELNLYSEIIDTKGVETLINLKTFNAGGYSTNVCDEWFTNLLKLETLYLIDTCSVSNEGIKHLVNLTYLDVTDNEEITCEIIDDLLNLTTLVFSNESCITKKSLSSYNGEFFEEGHNKTMFVIKK